jgi:hypothetical protein
MGARASWETVWSEDFNAATTTSSLTGWTFSGNCRIETNNDNSTNCLIIGTASDRGSATTPAIGVLGAFRFSFTYFKASGTFAELQISLTGGGKITESSKTLFLNNSSHETATFNVTGATASTKIVFYASEKSMAIDDLVVQQDVQASPLLAASILNLRRWQ